MLDQGYFKHFVVDLINIYLVLKILKPMHIFKLTFYELLEVPTYITSFYMYYNIGLYSIVMDLKVFQGF